MVTITEARGVHSNTFSKKPTRIVSLVPSQTELLYHLGLADEVIGITKFCVHPAEWFQTKQKVGGTKNLQLEKIKQLQPDFILANKEENEKDEIEELAALFPVWVTDVTDLRSACQMIETIGFLTGKCKEADLINKNIGHAFQQWKQRSPLTGLQVCYLIWKDPFMTVGGDTFIHAMLQEAGFINNFAAEKRYPVITLEQLAQKSSDLLLLSSEPYPFTEKHAGELRKILPHTKILVVDGEAFSWYGSRLQHTPAYFSLLHETISKQL